MGDKFDEMKGRAKEAAGDLTRPLFAVALEVHNGVELHRVGPADVRSEPQLPTRVRAPAPHRAVFSDGTSSVRHREVHYLVETHDRHLYRKAVVLDGKKYVRTWSPIAREELYDVRAGPGELEDL